MAAIAEVLQLGEVNVKSRLLRGRRQLKRMLEGGATPSGRVQHMDVSRVEGKTYVPPSRYAHSSVGKRGQPESGGARPGESMLEHAVVHPLRHTFQLEELMEAQAGGEKR